MLAKPGGMVLIDPGVYRESVTVTTPYITIRGMDRNRVVIDGRFERAIGIHVIEADGVTIENLTVRNHLLNGVQWTGVHGYWGSFLTAYGNGDYGIFAYDSDWGQFDRSYASGSPDSGFYIGQCFPCHAVVRDVIAEHNALGFSGTNAGGDLAIVNSEWRFNLAGIVPNTLDSEADPPQRDMLIAGNFVHDNNSTNGRHEGAHLSDVRHGHPGDRRRRQHDHREPRGEPRALRHRRAAEPRPQRLGHERERGARQRRACLRPGRPGAGGTGGGWRLFHRQRCGSEPRPRRSSCCGGATGGSPASAAALSPRR